MKKQLQHLCFLLLFMVVTSSLVVSCSKNSKEGIEIPDVPPASISSIFPERGKAGTIVTISGNNFGTDIAKVKIKFDIKEASNIISVTDTAIKVETPLAYSDSLINVSVLKDEVASSNVKSFYYIDTLPPSISSVKGTCFYGSTMVIDGTNFSTHLQDLVVKFGEMDASVIAASKTALTVITPKIGDVTSSDVTVIKSDIISNTLAVPVEVDQNKIAAFEWTDTTVRPGIVYKTGELNIFNGIRKIHILDVVLNENNKLGIGVSESNTPTTFKSTVAICESYNAIAGINAGYFKLGTSSDKDPYIRIDGKTVQEGHLNVSQTFTNSALLIHNNIASVKKFTDNSKNLNAVAAAIPTEEAENIIVCGPMLVYNNLIENLNMAESHNSSITGRTALGVTADGKRVMMMVTEYRTTGAATPRGTSTLQLAKIMQALGAVNAMNFDGGGSSTMYVKDMGTNGRVSINGSSLRAVRSVIYVK